MNLTSNTQVSLEMSKSYLDLLLAGDRQACRAGIDQALQAGTPAYDLLVGLVYPTMELVQSLYRDDRITITQLNLATRLNRSLTDQLTAQLPRNAENGKKALVLCGNAEPEELGGQICADLFESDGWNVRFTGAGVPDDEVLKLVGEFRPDLLVFFATLPQGMPAVRKLIDYIREVNAAPDMQIMCAGGIYKRAEGLSDEIGADLYAPDAADAIRVANHNPSRRATVDQQTVGRTRRIKKAELRRTQQTQRIAPRRIAPPQSEAA